MPPPFVHSPRLPAVDATLSGLMPLTVVAAALVALGVVGWRRRDLHG